MKHIKMSWRNQNFINLKNYTIHVECEFDVKMISN